MAAKKMLSLLLIVAAVAAPVLARGPTLGDIWKDCSKSSDPLRLNKITIVPDPPVLGKDVTFTGNFTLEERITGGEATLNLKYDDYPFDEHYKLCDLVKAVNRTCPLEKGELVLKISYGLPKYLPSGHVTGKVLLTDQNQQELVCITLDFNV